MLPTVSTSHCEVRERDQQADGADDARVHRGLGEAAEQDAVEHQARAAERRRTPQMITDGTIGIAEPVFIW